MGAGGRGRREGTADSLTMVVTGVVVRVTAAVAAVTDVLLVLFDTVGVGVDGGMGVDMGAPSSGSTSWAKATGGMTWNSTWWARDHQA